MAAPSVKPVLNWANVCSPNILRTVRRTMIRFLTELLVRRIWFGQSKLYFILNWLVMRCKLRPEHAADTQQTAWSKMYAKVKSIYFHHPSHGNSANYCLILGLRDKAAPPTSQQIPSEASEEPSDTVIHFYFYFVFNHRRALLSANQRQWSSNRTNVPRTCWAKLFGPRI